MKSNSIVAQMISSDSYWTFYFNIQTHKETEKFRDLKNPLLSFELLDFFLTSDVNIYVFFIMNN
jgi:hypothetical protein